MTVLVSTAYMEEAERFEHLVAIDGGRVLAQGTTAEIWRARRRTRWRTPTWRCRPATDASRRADGRSRRAPRDGGAPAIAADRI